MFVTNPCYYWLSVFKRDVRHGKHVRDQSVLLCSLSVFEKDVRHKKHVGDRSVLLCIVSQCVKQT